MRLVAIALAALVLVGCGGGSGSGSGSGDRAELPLIYVRSYGGVAGGNAELRIDVDGRATLFGGPTGGSCATEDTKLTLSEAELARVEQLLESAHEIEPRTVDEPATEAPSFALDAGDVVLHYSGYDVVPADAEPLFAELDEIVATHCATITP